ncbi:hypothetical protein [uncultured Negativibacillus sp.]|nr:hypothetical protein [uncultured Negativibacillus sp.]
MAKKNEKNCRKNNMTDTTIQTSKNCKNEYQQTKTPHPEKPEIKNY